MRVLRHSILAIVCIAARGASAREAVVVEVSAGQHDRQNTPIFVSLPESMRGAAGLSLTQMEDNAPVAVQFLSTEKPQAAWILRAPLPAGAKRRYRLESTDATAGSAPIATCVDSEGQLAISIGQKPVLKYQHAVKEPPEGIEPVYQRSGYIHPVFTPAGRVITDDFPPDEPHQHGVFLAWVNTTVGGHNVNFWDPKALSGHVEHSAVKQIHQGDVFAGFQVQLIHSDITNPEKLQPVFDETWTVRVYNLERQFLIDFESIQTCVTDSCTVNKHYYGGMAFRGLRSWFDDKSVALVTNEGKDQQTGNESRPKWVRMTGPASSAAGKGESLATFLAMGHPNNFRASQPVRLHPDKPYFCFAPEIVGPFTIARQESFVSRYRFLVFDGEIDSGLIQRTWNDYADPPEIRQLKHEQ
jgi:hypothetical protein